MTLEYYNARYRLTSTHLLKQLKANQLIIAHDASKNNQANNLYKNALTGRIFAAIKRYFSLNQKNSPRRNLLQKKKQVRNRRKILHKKQVLTVWMRKAYFSMKKAKSISLFNGGLNKLYIHTWFNKYRNEVKSLGELDQKAEECHKILSHLVI